MVIKQKILFLALILIGLTASFSVSAANLCPTDNGAGVVCSGGTPYYCRGACNAEAQCGSGGWTASPICASGFSCANAATADTCGYLASCDATHTRCGAGPGSYTCTTLTVTPTLPCNHYDSCNGYCDGCQGGYTMCNSTHVCRANLACLPGQTFNPCTNVCDGTASVLKLGYDSVSGSNIIQSTTYPSLFIPSTGNVGIGSISPNDLFSIGTGGITAPAGSSNTGHNFTNTYLSADKYALANYGLVETLIANSGGGLWGGAVGSNIWNLNSGNVGIGTANPYSALTVAINSISYGSDSGMLSVADLANVNKRLNLGYDSTLGTDGSGYIQALKSGSGYTPLLLNAKGGNVGVGTTNPGAPLHVMGTTSSNIGMILQSGAGFGGLKIGADVNTNTLTNGVRKLARIVAPAWNSGSTNVDIFTYDASSASLSDIYYGGTPGGSQYAATGLHFITAPNSTTTGGTERMTVDLNGNVGIGTTVPNAKQENLSTTEQLRLSYDTTHYASFTVNSAGSLTVGGTTGSLSASTLISSGIVQSGSYFYNVNAAASNKFVINAPGPKFMGFSGIGINSNANSVFNIGYTAAPATLITPVFSVVDNGNVGIGATSPNDKLSIGMGGIAAPSGSDSTGHNNTNTYISTDKYALANYGLVETLVSNATSTMTTIAKFVGATTVTVAGNNSSTAGTGYTQANSICSSATTGYTGSHVCTSFELLNSINTNSSPAIPVSSTLWFFNGPPGYTWNSNDCMGRTSIVHLDYGTVWVKGASGEGYGSLEFCDQPRKLACCK